IALLLELAGSVPPEVFLILGVRLAEATEAEGTELGGAPGAAGAPDGRHGVELAEAGPALGRILSRHTLLRRTTLRSPHEGTRGSHSGRANIGSVARICKKRKDLGTNVFLTAPSPYATVTVLH